MGLSAGGGSVVYLHGVGPVRTRWRAPVTRAVAGTRAALISAEYADLLTSTTRVHAMPLRSQPDARPGEPARDVLAGPPGRADEVRRSYVARQRYLTDLVTRVGESTSTPWPAGLPHPAEIADRLPWAGVLRAPVLGLDQVGRYLDDDARRAAVRQRIVSTLARAPRPRVVVAHSLGSMVAWDALADHRVEIDLLITLGSPLAHPTLAPSASDIPYARLGAWLNVVHLLDPVPAGRGLADAFPAAVDAFLRPTAPVSATGSPIARWISTVATAATSHLESTYLESRTVIAAMRQALGAPDLWSDDTMIEWAS